MSQGIEKQLKQYLKEIRLPLPVYGKEERVFIKDLKASMTEYIELNLGCTWEDVVSHFEEPEDAVYNYITSLDQPTIMQKDFAAQNHHKSNCHHHHRCRSCTIR